MWIPRDAAQIEEFAPAGLINETSIFDAKKLLSVKSSEIAKDIAAMANDGGVLLYGVAEDENKQPTVLNPIPLANEPERITNVVRTCIAEPPDIDIRPFPRIDDPSVGYIAVLVPPSPRAPHMVTLKGEHRYYVRTATGNIPATEGEVARLYARRKQWEFDINAFLSEAIEKRSPVPPHIEAAYLHIVCRPLSSRGDLLDVARKDQQSFQDFLNDLLRHASDRQLFSKGYSPNFNYPVRWIRRASGWSCSLDTDPLSTPGRHPTNILDFQVNNDGSAWLFCGRAGGYSRYANWCHVCTGRSDRGCNNSTSIHARAIV